MDAFQLRFLGTGAADWPMKPEGEERYDRSGRIRRPSSLLVNGCCLIDPAPESWFYARRVLGIELCGLRAIFLTHSHGDHFSHRALRGFLKGADRKVRLYCHESALRWLKLTDWEAERLEIHTVRCGEWVREAGMRVQVLEANHEVAHARVSEEERERPVHYLFERKGKRFFYGCDGGWFLAHTWSLLRKKELDLAVLDATVGRIRGDFRIASHNTLDMIELFLVSMQECQILKRDGQVVLSHLARTLHEDGEDCRDWTVAYDGMELQL